jgi:enoyl-CoA hydratase
MSLVSADREPYLTTVFLNRPEKLNALSGEMMDDLCETFKQLASDEELRVVILTAKGDKAFCVGTDIAELSKAEGYEVARRGLAICDLIYRFPVPVIGAINGLAAGGGCELALACHLRVASSLAGFSLPEAKLGLIPGYGGTQRLPREVGLGTAVEIMLTGRRLNAADAYRLGLVNRVVKPLELFVTAKSIAFQIAELAPLAVRSCLRAVVDGVDLPLKEGLALETTLFSRLFATEDMREGTKAFLEKRSPFFRGK